MPGATASLPGLTLTDALSLRMVEDAVTPLLPASLLDSLTTRFIEARNKLDALSAGNLLARWTDKVRMVPPTLALLPPMMDEGVWEELSRRFAGLDILGNQAQ